ncbi:MAG: VWA domain-containing protein [Bacteroidetes bacterium]|nr:VWA domain-containing protein [Bacteroidota bacterium]
MSSRNTIFPKRRSLRMVMIMSLLCCMNLAVIAQPNLTVKRLYADWPDIRLHFSVVCDNELDYSVTRDDVTILENGKEIQDITVWCPDPSIRAAISASLVFDASGSMAGEKLDGAIAAGKAFVDEMDGTHDEATVIWAMNTTTVYQQMTTSKAMLYSAIETLHAASAAKIWDGLYAGVLELINDGVNQLRAVVLLVDGEDVASMHSAQECLSLAQRHRIAIFTVGIGYDVESDSLQLLAHESGGRFYQTPNPAHLTMIYQEIFSVIGERFRECVASYESSCADGTERTVEFQLNDFCGGSTSETREFTAPLDSNSFTPLHMAVADRRVRSDEVIDIPIELLTEMQGGEFRPFSFSLRFDEQCMTLLDVTLPQTSLLDGAQLQVTPETGGVNIEVSGAGPVTGTGILMMLTVRTPAVNDSTLCLIEAVNAAFTDGCFLPVMDGGALHIIPDAPIIHATIDGPLALAWDEARSEYDPNPFDLTMQLFNAGEVAARNVRFRLDYDTGDVDLISPTTDTQVGVPPDLATDADMEAVWRLEALQRALSDTIRLCITASFDNHPDVTACHALFVPDINRTFHVDIEVDGPLRFCEGDSVVLRAEEGYASYLWSTGDTKDTLLVKSSGEYSCTVTDDDGFTGYSDPVMVEVHPHPPVPVISRSGDRLGTYEAHAHQWYRNGEMIPDGNERFLMLAETGSYQVRITNEHGCSRMSEEHLVTLLDIASGILPGGYTIDVYPDPATASAMMQITLPGTESARVWLYDMQGRATSVADIAGGSRAVRRELDLRDFPPGIYHIVLQTPSGLFAKKFMKY